MYSVQHRTRSGQHRLISRLARSLLLAGIVVGPYAPGHAVAQQREEIRLDIHPAETVSPFSPMLYGLITKEINRPYEGGFYAELLQNRTFHTTWQGILNWNSEAEVEKNRTHMLTEMSSAAPTDPQP